MRKTRYNDMLRMQIREHVSILGHKTLSVLVEVANERELVWHTQKWKRKQDQICTSIIVVKKARVTGNQS